MFVQALSGQARTNRLIEYRITIFVWLSKRPFLCPTCWAFYCPRIKADTYQARDNRQSTLLTQFIRSGLQKGLSNKGFCRQTHTHTRQFSSGWLQAKAGEPQGKTKTGEQRQCCIWNKMTTPFSLALPAIRGCTGETFTCKVLILAVPCVTRYKNKPLFFFVRVFYR